MSGARKRRHLDAVEPPSMEERLQGKEDKLDLRRTKLPLKRGERWR